MIDKLNDLIDLNLSLLLGSHDQSSFHLHDLVKRPFPKFKHLQLAEMMVEKGLIKLNGVNCTLSEKGLRIAKNGGWLTHLDNESKSKSEQQAKVDTKEQLETDLAKSNIEANKLNAKNAEQNSQNESKNRIAMWVNISVGVLNTVLLAIQIWLIVRK